MEGIGFVAAGNLEAGVKVRLASGEAAAIDSYEVIPIDEPIKVYNFEVEDYHTYYGRIFNETVNSWSEYDRARIITKYAWGNE